MKKFFILAAAAVVALASCTQNEMETTQKQEISYNAVAAKNAVRSIINTTYYAPTDPSFGIWGLYQATDWSTNHSASVWVGTDASHSAQISWDTTGDPDAWRNAANVDYWPLSGKLVFMGYSPYANVNSKAAISVADSKVTLTVTNFASATGSFVDDLMWSDAVEATKPTATTNYDADGTDATTYNGVPVVFHHALSQIIVNAKLAEAYTGYTIKITDVSLTVDDNATLTVQDNLSADPTVTWTEPATDVTPVVLENGDTALTTDYAQQGNAILVIPQTLTANQDVLTVTYTLTRNGSTSTATKVINLTAGSSDALTAFVANKKYNLNLIVSLDEILYSPSVADWTSGSSEYDVPGDAN